MAFDAGRFQHARAAALENFARRSRYHITTGDLERSEDEALRLLIKALGRRALGDLDQIPTASPSLPPAITDDVRVVPLSGYNAGIGTTNAAAGPFPGPMYVTHFTASTDVRRIAAGDGIVLVARQDAGFGTTLIQLIDNSTEILGGQPDGIGTQFFTPGPSGMSADASPNILIDRSNWYLVARMVNSEAVARTFGFIATLAAQARDVGPRYLQISGPSIAIRSYSAPAPPAPQGLAIPRAIRISTIIGNVPQASRIIPWQLLDAVMQREFLVNQANNTPSRTMQPIW